MLSSQFEAFSSGLLAAELKGALCVLSFSLRNSGSIHVLRKIPYG